MTKQSDTLRALQTIATYQFGRGAGAALFPTDEAIEIRRSASERPAQVFDATGRLVSFGLDGRFTLGFAGGLRLASALDPPAYRVAVGADSEPFVRDGANAFAKFVEFVDPTIRAGDEVMVVDHRDGSLLAVGRAELSATAMLDFETGVAVSVREGREAWKARS